jgi:hypothetical protein
MVSWFDESERGMPSVTVQAKDCTWPRETVRCWGGDDGSLLPVGLKPRGKPAGKRFVVAVDWRLPENRSSIMRAAGC